MGLSRLSRSIRGSSALITGAASGIGRATAELFADEGARVALLDIDGPSLAALKQRLEEAGAEVFTFEADLSVREQVAGAVADAVAALGSLDILVNNAGLALPLALEHDDYSQSWDTSMAVMLEAQAWAARTALPALRDAANPRIINLASTEALGATRFNSAYVAAQHGSLGLTRALAIEF